MLSKTQSFLLYKFNKLPLTLDGNYMKTVIVRRKSCAVIISECHKAVLSQLYSYQLLCFILESCNQIMKIKNICLQLS